MDIGPRGDWEPALEEADAAIRLNASDPWGHLSKGHALIYAGRAAEAREPLATALHLDPRGPSAQVVLHQCAVGRYFEADYRAAAAVARRALRHYPENPRAHIAFAASLGQLGRAEEAHAALEAAVVASPSIFRFITDKRPAYYRPVDHGHLLEGLRRAGWRTGRANQLPSHKGVTTRFVRNRMLRGEMHGITSPSASFRCRLPFNSILERGF